MSVGLVVLLSATLAALIAYALAQRSNHGPIDPDAEIHWLVTRLQARPALARFASHRLDRTRATGYLLSTAFVVAVTSALVVGFVFDMVTSHSGLAEWDSAVARWGAAHATARSTDLLRAITYLGAGAVVAAAALVAAVVDHRRSGNRTVYAFLAVVVGGASLLNNIVKWIVRRDRPAVAHLVSAAGTSFPSGHSASSAAAWAANALVLSRGSSRPVRALAGAAATLVAISVAASRALLGVHWLTDVVAGLALGWGWFMLVAIAFGGRLQRAGRPVEEAIGRPLRPESAA